MRPAAAIRRTAVRYDCRAMRREPGATERTAGADPARAWVKEWRQLILLPGVWWRKSAFDLARGPTHEPSPALAVAHRTGSHVPDLTRHGPPLPGETGPMEPARGGRCRRRPAAVGPRPSPEAGRRVLRRPGDGHRRRRVRQDPDDGGAGGLRRPPPRHAARGDRLHHLHEQGYRGDPATDAPTPAWSPGGHDPPARATGAEARRRPHRPALADGGGRRPEAAADRRLARRSTATRGSPSTSHCAGTRAPPR